MASIYLPFEDPNKLFIPTFSGILPGTPPPTIVGNPHLRGSEFVGLPGFGVECAEAVTNLVVDPDFPNLDNWNDWSVEGGETFEVGAQFAMDQGEFFGGLHIIVDDAGDGQFQNITIVDATDYTASVWTYATSGLLNLLVDKGDGASFENISSTKINEWERLVLPFTSVGVNGAMILRSAGAGAEGRFWMPQLEQRAYATPARVGAQPASCIYVPSPISETQTAWSIVSIMTPDWDFDTTQAFLIAWKLREDATNFARLFYVGSSDRWEFQGFDGSSVGAFVDSTHVRGDKIHTICTCDGYNSYMYINGVQAGPFAMKSVQPVNLILGSDDITANLPFNGVIDDVVVVKDAAIPPLRVTELYNAFKRGIPLHGLTELLTG